MKSQALELAASHSKPSSKLNIIREYIQACILRSFHESEAFNSISFVGGTALRFLYELPRFSEDLDFSVDDKLTYRAESWLLKLKRDLLYQNFEFTIKWSDKNNVHVGWIRFEGILQELGLSAHPHQKLSIKLEIDSNPPLGANKIKKVINRPFLFVVSHHSLESLFTGKVHALLTRKYTKGRDWYDLMWYLSRDQSLAPVPNYLQNALNQTGYNHIHAEKWKEELKLKAGDINWQVVRDDIKPFLENIQEVTILTAENIISVLQ